MTSNTTMFNQPPLRLKIEDLLLALAASGASRHGLRRLYSSPRSRMGLSAGQEPDDSRSTLWVLVGRWMLAGSHRPMGLRFAFEICSGIRDRLLISWPSSLFTPCSFRNRWTPQASFLTLPAYLIAISGCPPWASRLPIACSRIFSGGRSTRTNTAVRLGWERPRF